MSKNELEKESKKRQAAELEEREAQQVAKKAKGNSMADDSPIPTAPEPSAPVKDELSQEQISNQPWNTLLVSLHHNISELMDRDKNLSSQTKDALTKQLKDVFDPLLPGGKQAQENLEQRSKEALEKFATWCRKEPNSLRLLGEYIVEKGKEIVSGKKEGKAEEKWAEFSLAWNTNSVDKAKKNTFAARIEAEGRRTKTQGSFVERVEEERGQGQSGRVKA